jgi:hypothetical protein
MSDDLRSLLNRLAVVHAEVGEIGKALKAIASGTPAPQTATVAAQPRQAEPAADAPSCPKCGGIMWDNRLSKRNPKSPDYKCRSRSCDGVIWPPRAGGATRLTTRDDQPEYHDDPRSLPF